MKILAIEKEFEGKTSKHFQPYLKDEAGSVWELYKQNFIREIFFRADQSSAVLMLESESVEEARETLAKLPLVKKELIYFEIIPLVPYPGFERLFK
ncbi:MAG: superoxide dismutase [Ignavibacteriae bacterium]|nr:MAG: superoxide dismutase [Ignavibacteriota bacterium]